MSKKTKKPYFNLHAIQIRSKKYLQEHMPWMAEKPLFLKPEKRVKRKENSFISR